MLKGVNLINTWLHKPNDKAEYGRDLDHIVLGLREPHGVDNANNGHIGPFFAIPSGKRGGATGSGTMFSSTHSDVVFFQ
jgi:hypothetical protein